MILFTMLVAVFVLLAIVLATGVLTVGAGFLIAFADVIVFIMIIVGLVKLFGKKGNKKGS